MTDWIFDLFDAIDNMDPEKFVSYLDENAEFIFGNMSPVKGRENIKKAVSDFFGTIQGLRHEVPNIWTIKDYIFSELKVTYTRKDGKKVVVPGLNLFKVKNGKIEEYKIFIDISPVYQ